MHICIFSSSTWLPNEFLEKKWRLIVLLLFGGSAIVLGPFIFMACNFCLLLFRANCVLEEGLLLNVDKGPKWDWCDSSDHTLGFSCAIVSFWSGSKSILILFHLVSAILLCQLFYLVLYKNPVIVLVGILAIKSWPSTCRTKSLDYSLGSVTLI